MHRGRNIVTKHFISNINLGIVLHALISLSTHDKILKSYCRFSVIVKYFYAL